MTEALLITAEDMVTRILTIITTGIIIRPGFPLTSSATTITMAAETETDPATTITTITVVIPIITVEAGEVLEASTAPSLHLP